MTKAKQGDLFIQSDIPCNCAKTKHAHTETEFITHIDQIQRIKQLVLDNGWDLSYIYYRYLDPLNYDCNAWDIENNKYLGMRGKFTKRVEKVIIPLERKYH